jgi:AraC-like DNA-binding protein
LNLNIEGHRHTVSVETIQNNREALDQYLIARYGHRDRLNAYPDLGIVLQHSALSDRVPIEVVSAGIHQMAINLQEPNLGLEMASYLENTHQHISLFFSNLNFSFTDHLKMISRYIGIASEIFTLEVIETTDDLILQLTPNSPLTISHHQSEALTALVVRSLSDSQEVKLQRIDFTHSVPGDDTEIYQQVYGIQPYFQQDTTQLIFSTTSRDTVFSDKQSNSDSLREIQAFEAKHIKLYGEHCFLERCNFLLPILLCLGQPNKEQLATILCVTPRTLQRKLKAEGSTFRSLLQALRIELTEHHFKNNQVTCTELAFALGYQDYSQFFRAFKTWFGIPPEKYRQQTIDCLK